MRCAFQVHHSVRNFKRSELEADLNTQVDIENESEFFYKAQNCLTMLRIIAQSSEMILQAQFYKGLNRFSQRSKQF